VNDALTRDSSNSELKVKSREV